MSVFSWRRCAWIIILLIPTAYVSVLFSRQNTVEYTRTYSALIPLSMDGWNGRDVQVPEKYLDILGTRDVLYRIYEKKGGEEPIVLYIVFSKDNRLAVHPPEVCFLGTGYEVLDKSVVEVDDIPMVRLLVNYHLNRAMTLYCYNVGKKYTANFTSQQVNIVLERLKGASVISSLIRIDSAVDGGHSDKTQARLERFFSIFRKRWDRVVSEGK